VSKCVAASARSAEAAASWPGRRSVIHAEEADAQASDGNRHRVGSSQAKDQCQSSLDRPGVGLRAEAEHDSSARAEVGRPEARPDRRAVRGVALHSVRAVARTPHAAQLERREGGHREPHNAVLHHRVALARVDGGGGNRRGHRSPLLRTLEKESRTALGHSYTAPGESWCVRLTVRVSACARERPAARYSWTQPDAPNLPTDQPCPVRTILECRPSARTATDGPRRCAYSYGLGHDCGTVSP
jgi:hypothetical protein